ncbi:MAG TPA: tyrosine-protein phosphatase, partial [Pyrinomonadaceae bacterium]|nr:tyrosine-protein phosphatase [Pyrinomonadaceae bacterium]
MKRSFFHRSAGVALVVLALSVASFAQSAQQSFPNIKIKNFGQMDERFYRGAQPKKDDYRGLAELGVKTVIDLRDDATDYEKPMVEALGMRYVNIPMSDKDYPKESEIEAFLKLANDPATGAFYVHCAGGRHRTGVMGAVYRFTKYHWNYDQVYSEMKDYDFYTRFGHGDMKKYVQDYWGRIQTNNAAVATATASAA